MQSTQLWPRVFDMPNFSEQLSWPTFTSLTLDVGLNAGIYWRVNAVYTSFLICGEAEAGCNACRGDTEKVVTTQASRLEGLVQWCPNLGSGPHVGSLEKICTVLKMPCFRLYR